MVVNTEDKSQAVPSGSQPVDNTSKPSGSQSSGTEAAGKGQPTGQDTGSEGAGGEGGAGQQGEESTAQLMQTLQEQGAQFAQLAEALQQQRQSGDVETPGAQQQPSEPAPDFEAKVSELEKQLSDGEITTEDFAREQSKIMDQKLQYSMQQMMQQYQQEQSAQQVLQSYMQQNPDFNQVLQSKEAQQLMQQNPVFDEVSAYEHLKRANAEKQMQEMQQQVQALQQERDEAIKNGAKVTDFVSKEEGSEIRQGVEADNKNLSPEEGMLQAMRRARQGAAS